MDRQQIAAQLVSVPLSLAGSDDDPAFGRRMCRTINEGHAKLMAKHPGRFGAFASPHCSRWRRTRNRQAPGRRV